MTDNNNNDFQAWMDNSIYTDVRFYPINSEESSTVDVLSSALHSVKVYENNQGNPYKDDVETYL